MAIQFTNFGLGLHEARQVRNDITAFINMEEIHFSGTDPPLSSYEESSWELGESRIVEFFPGVSFIVSLVSVEDNDFSESLASIDVDEPIALDLEWEDELCLFQFCSSKGVIIVRHPDGNGNQLLENFLSTHKFYAKGIHNDKKMLMAKFGRNFAENIEDIAKTRLVTYGHSENFKQMTIQFAGQPTAEFKDIRITTSNWAIEKLTKRQVLYAAFDVVALFQAYKNFPPPKMRIRDNSNRPKSEHIHGNKLQQPTFKKVEQKSSFDIKMKSEILRPTYSYIIENYQGTKILTRIREHYQSYELDFVSVYSYEEITLLFVSSFVPINDLAHLPQFDINLASDGDILFITNSDDVESLKELLFCFGSAWTITDVDGVARIDIRAASQSIRFQTFLPHIHMKEHELKVFTFPFFIPAVRVDNLPSRISDQEVEELFSSCGKVTKVEMFRKRCENELQSACVTFSTEEEAENAAKIMNLKNGIHVFRYADESQLRFMRDYRINVLDMKDPQEMYVHFSQYGRIHHIFYDGKYNVGRVQFYRKYDALKAQSGTALISPQFSTIVIRDLPFLVTEEEIFELCSAFGTITNIILRDLNEFMFLMICEVTFTTPEAAREAKKALNRTYFQDSLIYIKIMNGNGYNAVHHKVEERNNWIGIDATDKTDEEIYEIVCKYGQIIEFNRIDDHVFVMFTNQDNANVALEDIDESYSISLKDFQKQPNNNCIQLTEKVREKKPFWEKDKPNPMIIIVEGITEETDKKVVYEEIYSRCPIFEYIYEPTDVEGVERLFIYTDGPKAARKISSSLLHTPLNSKQMIHPITKMLKDVNDLPPKLCNLLKDRIPVHQAPIVIDPLPDDMNEEVIYDICSTCRKFKLVIESSSKESGKKRAVLLAKNRNHRKQIWKAFNQIENLDIEKYDSMDIPEPPNHE